MTIDKSRLSKFQREAVDAITKLIGNRAFKCELTTQGRLKVLIEGLADPIYCASSSTDHRAIQNVRSEVRRRLKEAETSKQLPPPVMHADPKSDGGAKRGKVMRFIIKHFRDERARLDAAELDLIELENYPDLINSFRRQFVETGINVWLKQTKAKPDYLSQEDRDAIIKAGVEHINFAMPTFAHYQSVIKAQLEAASELEKIITDTPDINADYLRNVAYSIDGMISASKESKKDTEESAEPEPEPLPVPEHEPAPEPETAPNALTAFFAASQAEQIEALKATSLEAIDQLIASCEAAKEAKKVDDMQEIVQIMQAKGLTLEQINNFMSSNKAALER